MKNIIFSNRENDSITWIEVTKGVKYITLNYATIEQGSRDITITYNLSDEEELLKTLNDPMCNIDSIVEHGWGPKPVKTVIHEAVR